MPDPKSATAFSASNAATMPPVTSAVVAVLTPCNDLAVGKQDGIGIGTANVDSDTLHDWNTELKSRSYPKARGPTWSSPRGVRKTGAAGSAITVVRWP